MFLVRSHHIFTGSGWVEYIGITLKYCSWYTHVHTDTQTQHTRTYIYIYIYTHIYIYIYIYTHTPPSIAIIFKIVHLVKYVLS